jgi:hypothetical protein
MGDGRRGPCSWRSQSSPSFSQRSTLLRWGRRRVPPDGGVQPSDASDVAGLGVHLHDPVQKIKISFFSCFNDGLFCVAG